MVSAWIADIFIALNGSERIKISWHISAPSDVALEKSIITRAHKLASRGVLRAAHSVILSLLQRRAHAHAAPRYLHCAPRRTLPARGISLPPAIHAARRALLICAPLICLRAAASNIDNIARADSRRGSNINGKIVERRIRRRALRATHRA